MEALQYPQMHRFRRCRILALTLGKNIMSAEVYRYLMGVSFPRNVAFTATFEGTTLGREY